MILRDYEDVAAEFFSELVERGGSRLPALFNELLTTRIFKSGRDMRMPTTEANAWLQGQISICDEYLTKFRMAWEEREAKANAERENQFQKGGVQGS